MQVRDRIAVVADFERVRLGEDAVDAEIVRLIDFDVRFDSFLVNPIAVRREPLARRQLQVAAVRQIERCLDDALAERLVADHGRPRPFLERTGENLGRRGRAFVRQDEEAIRFRLTGATALRLTLPLRVLDLNDRRVRRDEPFDHRDDGRQQATRVSAHVDDEAIDVLTLEFLELFQKFVVGRFGELGHLQIADLLAGFFLHL